MQPPLEFIDDEPAIITQVEKALKGHAKAFDIQIIHSTDPLIQLQKTREVINNLLKDLSIETKGFKFIEILQVKLVKYSYAGKKIIKITKNGYFNSSADLIINETDMKLSLQASQQQIK